MIAKNEIVADEVKMCDKVDSLDESGASLEANVSSLIPMESEDGSDVIDGTLSTGDEIEDEFEMQIKEIESRLKDVVDTKVDFSNPDSIQVQTNRIMELQHTVKEQLKTGINHKEGNLNRLKSFEDVCERELRSLNGSECMVSM